MNPVSRSIASVVITIIAAFAAAPGIAGTLTQQKFQEQQQRLQRARDHIDQGEPREALDVLEDVIDEDDRLWVAYYLKGMAHGQMGDEDDALEAFLAADERQPGVAEVYLMAGIAAFGVGEYETCWEMTILAHQAGQDMSKEIEQLSEVIDPPDNLEERLNAPRVIVGPMDTRITENNSAMESVLMQIQGELAVVQQQFEKALRDSPNFGLVRLQELAYYVVVMSIEDYGGAVGGSLSSGRPGDVQGGAVGVAPGVTTDLNVGAAPGAAGGSIVASEGRDNAQGRPTGGSELTGVIHLVDRRSSDVAFSLPFTLPNLTSIGDLSRDVRRRVALLENWAIENHKR
ncbi:MAG TPA: tetratricopeptide repeat protein [Acidobacteriota bacterium]|nr:tetratricopeptide repeat protein [Acidobacteriota bacterium]